MILAVDIGNTNMEFGVFDSDKLKCNFRLVTDRSVTSDEVGLMLIQFMNFNKIDVKSIDDIIIVSVVPQVMYSVNNAMLKYIGKKPLIIGENIFVNIKNAYDNPAEVGGDRLVDAYAAYKKYGGPLIVVDFGTATTFDVVDECGAYQGGVIFPGIKISMEALFSKTSKLPRIELVKPDKVIGKNTVSSMQSGAMYGYIGAVKNIVENIESELSSKPKVIATGGLASLIGKDSGVFHSIDKTLTLNGLFEIYKNKSIN